MKTILKTRLTGDATLIAAATGGIYDTSDLPENHLTRSFLQSAGALDEWGRIPPTLVLIWGAETPTDRYRAERYTLTVWGYEQDGYSGIDAAFRRVKTLLINWIAPSGSNESVMNIAFEGGTGEFVDPELQANGRAIRFGIEVLRKE